MDKNPNLFIPKLSHYNTWPVQLTGYSATFFFFSIYRLLFYCSSISRISGCHPSIILYSLSSFSYFILCRLYSVVFFILPSPHCLASMHFPPSMHFPLGCTLATRSLYFLLLPRTFPLPSIFPKNCIKTISKDACPTTTFGDNVSAKILEKGTISLGNKKVKVENVLLVENTNPNLLNVSQTCDQGNILIFDSQKCEIRKEGSGKLVVFSPRTPSDVYILNIEEKEKCRMIQIDKICLWNKRMGHIGF
jgi:hypothetical protein